MKVHIQNSIPKEKYTLEFIFSTIGIPFIWVDDFVQADFIYAEKRNFAGETSLKKAIIFAKTKTDIISSDIIERGGIVLSKDNIYEFDIINAICFFLLDEGNKNLSESDYDQHKRLKYESSFQFRNGIGDFPIINKYILFLKKILHDRLGQFSSPFFPKSKNSCIILSHDVDNPGKYDHLYNFPFFVKEMNFKGMIKHYREYAYLLKSYLLDSNRSQYWVFNELIEAEKKYGFTSTSFFASINEFSSIGNRLDVPYDLSQRKYKKIISKLIENNFEVALHASYNALESKERFKAEKDALQRVAGHEISGLRHHYWHLGPNPISTLRKHSDTGFKYDSSLAFNDHLGYRRNVAFPYFPFDENNKMALNTLQIPVFCMDGNLFYKDDMQVKEAVDEILKQIKVIQECNGVASIDWHIRTSIPNVGRFKKWGEAYLSILEELSMREDIWVTNCKVFSEWWMNRIEKY